MELQDELERIINKASRENDSDTPDYLLAEFMMKCLIAGESMIKARDNWFGIKDIWKDKVMPKGK